MKTIDILNGLQDYLTLLSTIKEHESIGFTRKGDLAKTVSLSYSFITLDLNFKPENNDHDSLYLKCKFEMQKDKATIASLYCEDRGREDNLRKFIEHHAPVAAFPSITNFNNYHPDVLRYFTIADEIAQPAVLCSSGDDYKPGYYSEIVVEEERIALRQINWHNAKSSAHKDNYHMRELEFLIPLKGLKLKPSFSSEGIGDMIINFRDSSSKQNKVCGDKIREKIEEEKGKFKG